MNKTFKDLAFSVESLEEYVDTVLEAKFTASKEFTETVFAVNPFTPELAEEIRQTTFRDGALLLKERHIIEAVQNEYMQLSPQDQNEVIKCLLNNPDDTEPNAQLVSQALVGCLAAPNHDGSKPHIEVIIEKLKAGELDHLIYEYSIASEAFTSRTTALRAMTELVLAVTARIAPELSQTETIRTTGLEITHFTNGSIQELHNLRQELVRRLAANLDATRSVFSIPGQRKDVAVLGAQLAIHIENYTYFLNNRHTTSNERGSVSRRKQINQRRLEEIEKTGKVEVQKPVFQPRKIYGVRSTGDGYEKLSDITEEQVEDALITEFENKHKGTPKLRENLKNYINYIRNADFSTGMIPGIKQFNRITLDGKTAVLYSLKPGDAVGVPTSTKTTNQARIYFLLDEHGDAAVVKIVDRDEARVFEQGLGLGQKRRK